jgi:hypothetical protein
MTPTNYSFLSTLAPGCIGDLRKIDILIDDEAHVLRWDRCWVVIDLSPRAEFCDICSHDNMRRDPWRMECELSKVLENVCQREGGKKLVLQDFYALSSAVERAVKHKWSA